MINSLLLNLCSNSNAALKKFTSHYWDKNWLLASHVRTRLSNATKRKNEREGPPGPHRAKSIGYVVKRKWEAPLIKANRESSLRKRHYIYETLPDPHSEPRIIPVYLTEYVPDLGRPGEVVNLEDNVARRLIITKFGIYASPENLATVTPKLDEDAYSTKYVGTTKSLLANYTLKIPMSADQPWSLEPWHVRTAFRLSGIHVPENTITLPDDPISGPNKLIEGNEFHVKILINKKEKIDVKCQIIQPIEDDD